MSVTTWIVVGDQSTVGNLVTVARSLGGPVGAVVAGPRSVAETVARSGVDKVVWCNAPDDVPYSGNFHTADPYADLAKIAPYAVNVQLKMKVHAKDETDNEGKPSDVPRVLKILKDANYQGWFTLEYEDKEDPFVAVPRILGELKPLLG